MRQLQLQFEPARESVADRLRRILEAVHDVRQASSLTFTAAEQRRATALAQQENQQ
jgi:hypothetical protein